MVGLGIIITVLLLIVLFVVFQNYRVNYIRRTVKVSDNVYFFRGNERIRGKVSKVKGNRLTVLYFDEKHEIQRSDIY